jgi:hypothetical protein
LAAPSAFATTAHSFSESEGFGSSGSGAGQLSSPKDIAVSEVGATDGDVYVADTGNHRVDEFDAQGNFIRAWGWGVADGLPHFETCTLICEAGIAGSGPGQFEAGTYIAVDNSTTSVSSGDVYVADTGTRLVQKFGPSGELIESWGNGSPSPNGQLSEGTNTEFTLSDGTHNSVDGRFESMEGLAVDAAGNLWVSGSMTFEAPNKSQSRYAVLSEFDEDGTGIQSWPDTSVSLGAGGIAVDGEDDLYLSAFVSRPIVVKFSSSGTNLGTVFEAQAASQFTGIARDSTTGVLYLDVAGDSVEQTPQGCEPEAPCTSVESFGSEQLKGDGSGVATNAATGTVYVAASTTGRVLVYLASLSAVTASAGEITAKTATLKGTVDPLGSTVSNCRFEYGTSIQYGNSVPCEGSVGSGPSPVQVHITGLEAGAVYHYRLVAAAGSVTANGEDEQFETLPTPGVEDVASEDMTAESVDLTATINPRGFDTTYQFEWGTTTSYGSVAPASFEDIGSAASGLAEIQHISGISPDVPYHYRVVARNQNGTTITPDHTFVYETVSASLPDGRAYEMVTPPHKDGALIGDTFLGVPTQIAEDGSSVFATSIQCFAGSESCTASRQAEGEPFLFTRAQGGWTTTALAPSAVEHGANSYWVGGADAGDALFSMPTAPAGEDDWYVRKADGALIDIGPSSEPALGALGIARLGAIIPTPDFSHIVWNSQPVWPSIDKSMGNSIYEYVGQNNKVPVLVDVIGGEGSTELIGRCGARLGGRPRTEPEALSENGSVVYFTVAPCSPEIPAEELYARVDQSHTVPISQHSSDDCSSTCQSSPPSNATFEGASRDGTKAFFTSSQQLTDEASQGTANLYEYDFNAAPGHNLTAVSAADASSGSPQVLGMVGVSSDGSHVYFVARGALAGKNLDGRSPQVGADNLYVYERDDRHPAGRVAFIAALSQSDSFIWEVGSAANVTPDGRYLVFPSRGKLTRDDTSNGTLQIFRYDSQTEELIRISIGNYGFNDNGNVGEGAAKIAEPSKSLSVRKDPTMSHDGSYVFFESTIALTPEAPNNVQVGNYENSGHEIVPIYIENVYEYHDGHVYLISDGKDTGFLAGASDTKLLGSDATGANVFFTIDDQLVPSDTDTQLDIYDARICSPGDPCISQPPPSLPPCLGEACHGTPAESPFSPITPTATFTGQSNQAQSPAVKGSAVVKKKKKMAKAKKRQVCHRLTEARGKCQRASGHKTRARKGGRRG